MLPSRLLQLARSRSCDVLVAAALVACAGGALDAQQLDSARAGIQRPASPVIERVPMEGGSVDAAAADTLRPPITPRRAFLYSFLIPGSGQARLDRSRAGAMFFVIELSAIMLAHRSAEDLRIARRFSRDSIPLRYQLDAVTGQPVLDANGAPTVAEWRTSRYDAAYVRTRKLHYEDWLAVVAFNHLFAGADAFVAAQLWDLPAKVAIRRTPVGTVLGASIPFR